MDVCNNEYKLYEYTEAELPAQQRTEIEMHLESCEACRSTIEDYASIKSSVFRFYDQVDLNKSTSAVKPEMESSERYSKSYMRYALLTVFFILSFVYVFLSPIGDSKDINTTIMQDESYTGIDDSRWNLDVNLIENKIESIRAEIENINKNKKTREL